MRLNEIDDARQDSAETYTDFRGILIAAIPEMFSDPVQSIDFRACTKEAMPRSSLVLDTTQLEAAFSRCADGVGVALNGTGVVDAIVDRILLRGTP